MNLAPYDELVFTWKKKITETVFEHKIPSDLILNFDQTSLGFAIPLIENYIYKKELPKFPIANSDDKRQITGAFTVNLLGYFLPMLLVYTGTTGLCHPKMKFLSEFDITHILNHCSNEELVISLLKKIVIPFI